MTAPSHLTRHALIRHAQRVGGGLSVGVVARAIAVPPRLAVKQWPKLVGDRSSRARVRCSATAAFVCRGRHVVTAIGLDGDDLATLLTWLLTRTWIPRRLGDAP